jgi:ABC-type multidrug transport system fused ATPase/permease subunit
MKYISTALAAFFALALIVAIGIAGYYALKSVADAFAHLDFQTTAIITASLVALLIAMIIARSLRKTNKQNKANLLHAEKAATYQLFAEVWSSRLQATADQTTTPEEVAVLDWVLGLYGGPNVIKAYAAFRKSEQVDGTQSPSTQALIAKVILEMRHDLGTDVGTLTSDDVRQLVLSDFSQPVAAPAIIERRDQQPRIALTLKAE